MADLSLFLAGFPFILFGAVGTWLGLKHMDESLLAFFLIPTGLCMMFAGYTGVGL